MKQNKQILISQYLQYIKTEKNLSQNTLAAYKNDLDQFALYLNQNNIDVWPTDPASIDAYLEQQRNNKKVSSISRILSALRKFYRWLDTQKILSKNPMYEIDMPKKEYRMPTSLTQKEVKLIFDQIDINSKMGLRDKALLELMYATGMQVSEVINLKLSDIHKDIRLIQITSQAGKQRVVPITDQALDDIYSYNQILREELLKKARKPTQVLFLNYLGQPITRQAVWQIIKKYCKKANIKKDVTPNTLRHTFAITLLENGADLRVVQEILGHTSINSTQVYATMSHKHIREVYQRTHPRA